MISIVTHYRSSKKVTSPDERKRHSSSGSDTSQHRITSRKSPDRPDTSGHEQYVICCALSYNFPPLGKLCKPKLVKLANDRMYLDPCRFLVKRWISVHQQRNPVVNGVKVTWCQKGCVMEYLLPCETSK